MSEPRTGYKSLRIWQFHSEYWVPRSEVPGLAAQRPPRPGAAEMLMRSKTFGVLALDFDSAYALFRERKPDVRITAVSQHDISVHYGVIPPDAVTAAGILTGEVE